MDLYSNIPSFVTNMQDGNLKVQTPTPIMTQKVLILGTATDGPKNVPVSVRGIQSISSLYGAFDTTTPLRNLPTFLMRGIFEAYNAGCNNVTVCRVTGDEATITLSDTNGTAITLRSLYAGSKYNDLKAAVAVNAGTATVTLTLVSGATRTYTFTSTKTYNDIVVAINSNSTTDLIVAETELPDTTQVLSVAAEDNFESGLDGVPTDYATDEEFQQAYQDALAVTYALLEGYDTEIVVPMGAYIDPVEGDQYSFAQNLAQFCFNGTSQNSDTLGVISIKPLYAPTLTKIASRVSQLQDLTLSFTAQNDYTTTTSAASASDDRVDAEGNSFDTGKFLSILAGPDTVLFTSKTGRYSGSGEAAYAGLMSRLPVQSAPTNKVLGGVAGLTYSLSNKQMNTLGGLRFVTFANKSAGTVVTSAMTYATVGSDWTRLSTIRIAFGVVSVIRGICEPYIGEGNNPAVRNAMSTAIQSALDSLRGSGVVQDFAFNLVSTATDQVAGNILLYLDIVPAFEIRKITLVLALKAAI